MKVNAVVCLLNGVLIQVVRNSLAGGPISPPGEAPVHLLTVYGIEGPAVVKGVNVDNQHSDYPSGKMFRIKTIDNSSNYGQPIQLVPITYGLNIEGWAGLGAV
jgi:hypothetical protein